MAYLKAYAALLGAVVTALIGVYADNQDVSQWLTVVGVVLTAVATYAVPNKDPKGQHQAESVQPPNYGNGGLA